MTWRMVVVSWLGALALVTACSSGSTSGSSVSSASVAGKTFVSTSVIGHDLVSGTKITLTFDGPTLSASAGCNTMSAEYTLDNSTLRWTGLPRSTLVGCDAELSAQDHWLSTFLQTGAAASISGRHLTLKSSATTINLQAQ